MAKRSAKKGPRKGRVPGGQRTATFSGSDWTLALDSRTLGGTSLKCRRGLVSEAARRQPCQRRRSVVRRKAHPPASPVQTHPHGLFTLFRISSRSTGLVFNSWL